MAKPAAGPLFRLFRQQASAGLLEIVESSTANARKFKVQAFQRFDHGCRHDNAAEPLVVGGNHVPWSLWRAGVTDHVLVGEHVLIPQLALREVANLELPMLSGVIEAFQKAPLLLRLGQLQMKLENPRAIAR